MEAIARAVDTAKLIVLRLLLLADAAVRAVRPKHASVLRRMDGRIAPGTRKTLCLFAHFDRDGLVDDYVVYYLTQLERLGCEIIFVSTAEDMDAAQIEKVSPYCRTIMIRENLGHDFGSWKAGLAEIDDLLRYNRLVIANDSVYGPLFDLGEVFDRMNNSDADFWGITDSRRYSHHVQSYFVVFGRSVLASPAFAAFWHRLPDYRFKHSVILACEVGLSRLLVDTGFTFQPLCPYEKVWRRHREQVSAPSGWREPSSPANSTLWRWETLLRDFRCPFLKVQLLRNNPKNVIGVERWNDIISCCSSYDPGLIRRHLDRLAARNQR